MPVFAMTCTRKTAHEKTDTLWIYTFESPALGPKVIVANLTNVYEVGDTVAIAQLGTRLPGVELKPRKVFGIDSEGMALGPVEAALDTDLSNAFDADRAPRRFRVLVEVEVEVAYAEEAEKAAQKLIKAGEGKLWSIEPTPGAG